MKISTELNIYKVQGKGGLSGSGERLLSGAGSEREMKKEGWHKICIFYGLQLCVDCAVCVRMN